MSLINDFVTFRHGSGKTRGVKMFCVGVIFKSHCSPQLIFEGSMLFKLQEVSLFPLQNGQRAQFGSHPFTMLLVQAGQVQSRAVATLLVPKGTTWYLLPSTSGRTT